MEPILTSLTQIFYIIYVRDNAWLAGRSALKLFNAHLAVHYPAYTLVICKHLQGKAVNVVWLF